MFHTNILSMKIPQNKTYTFCTHFNTLAVRADAKYIHNTSLFGIFGNFLAQLRCCLHSQVGKLNMTQDQCIIPMTMFNDLRSLLQLTSNRRDEYENLNKLSTALDCHVNRTFLNALFTWQSISTTYIGGEFCGLLASIIPVAHAQCTVEKV